MQRGMCSTKTKASHRYCACRPKPAIQQDYTEIKPLTYCQRNFYPLYSHRLYAIQGYAALRNQGARCVVRGLRTFVGVLIAGVARGTWFGFAL